MKINDHFRYLNIGLPEDILRRKIYGDYTGAIRLIDRRLAENNITAALRSCLIVQREIMLRAPLDYPLTKADALAILRNHIPDFTEEEFDERVDSGKIGWIYIDGEMRFFNRFFETMLKADPAFATRAGMSLAGAESNVDKNAPSHIQHCISTMKEKGSMTQRIRVRASMRVKDDVFEKGMFIRAHLPIPAACEQQRDIRIESYSPAQAVIDPEDVPQRTICWELNMEENEEFYVEYSYIHTATYHDLTKTAPTIKEEVPQQIWNPCTEIAVSQQSADPCTETTVSQQSVDPCRETAVSQQSADPCRETAVSQQTSSPYTREESPHIVFTPYIKELVASLTKGVSDPLEKARIFYDFITLNMKYTFMPAYFNLENIPETCARNYTGDCGVFALLFITLCRCAGIPACWQSGLTAEPDFCGAHDWARFYVEPYGWLYADTSYGVAAVRTGDEERRKFYFGNLDAYRMVANNAFQAPFMIDKDHWRADPYDNQVGEMETTDRGLNYSEYERSKVTVSIDEIL